MEQPKIKRCAIYTRKSNEDGLEQEYNSLDAQRDNCEHFIHSQSHDGWRIMPDRYDDGGISGGTTERPGLKQLLADVKAGRVDIIVVYKIDRLSRSMFDFLKMMEMFKEYDVSFVSVTQNINTENAVGRLMLNILQSFAQFEMEQTGERIRDKIASSKAKGYWLGGRPPIGYDVADGGGLIKNPDEAETVNYIFRAYLKIGSMNPLIKHLKEKGYKTKGWISKSGRVYEPKNFSKSGLYRLLGNPVYIGKIRHAAKNKVYDGKHEAILEEDIFDKVQKLRQVNTISKPKIKNNQDRPYLLKGILENPHGYAMTPSFQKKNGKRYRYYVSIESIKKGAASCPVKTVSAHMIEEIITERIFYVLSSPEWIKRIIQREDNKHSLPQIRDVAKNIKTIWDALFPIEQARIVQTILERVAMHPDKLVLSFRPFGMVSVLNEMRPELDISGQQLNEDEPITMIIPTSIKRRGARKYIKTPKGYDLVDNRKAYYNETLIKAVVKGHSWLDELDRGIIKSSCDIAERDGVDNKYVKKALKTTTLAPDIIENILNGKQPKSLTFSQLRNVPLLWSEQREHLGFRQAS